MQHCFVCISSLIILIMVCVCVCVCVCDIIIFDFVRSTNLVV